MNILRKLWSSVLLDHSIEKKYIKAGASFGHAVSLLYMGECIGFNKRFEDWRKLEKNYVNHGFRTVSLDDFIKLGGYGKSIDGLIGEKLGQDEEPIFHAEIYNEEYFGKVEPVIDINELMIPNGGIQRGQYRLPSTE